MSLNQRYVEESTHNITHSFDSDLELNWRWEDNHKAMLTEFARNKKDKVLNILREQFDHEWNRKSIKKAPKALADQLGELTKLSKEQLLFTIPAFGEQPAMVAIWWPWGHGATVSLRLMPIKDSYKMPDTSFQKDSFFTVVKKLFS